MQTSIRNITCFLSVLLFLFGMIVPAAADEIGFDSETGISSTQEQAVRIAVETYFEQRHGFLSGIEDSYPAISDWYRADLTKHRTVMEEAGVTRLEATLEITDLHIYFKETHVYATEHLIYEKNGTICREEISHDFLLGESSSGWKVIDDAYYEAASSFASCSYIPPESSSEQTGAGDGSASCIVNIANGEVGLANQSEYNTIHFTWYQIKTTCVSLSTNNTAITQLKTERCLL